MSFKIELNSKATIEVVVHKDQALAMTPEEYEFYLKDCTDLARLKFKDGLGYEDTTRFVMRKALTYRATQKVIDSQTTTKVINKKEVETNISLKYILEEVKHALVGIKNAEGDDGLEYVKGSDGTTADELIAGIYQADVLGDLHGAWSNAVKGVADDETVQKKS